METITYRERVVAVTLIGMINRRSRMDGDATDTHDYLLRDKAGRYYLRREIDQRSRVHLVSAEVAILWAVQETANGEDTWSLRYDAGRLLSEVNTLLAPPFPFDSWTEYRQARATMQAMQASENQQRRHPASRPEDIGILAATEPEAISELPPEAFEDDQDEESGSVRGEEKGGI